MIPVNWNGSFRAWVLATTLSMLGLELAVCFTDRYVWPKAGRYREILGATFPHSLAVPLGTWECTSVELASVWEILEDLHFTQTPPPPGPSYLTPLSGMKLVYKKHTPERVRFPCLTPRPLPTSALLGEKILEGGPDVSGGWSQGQASTSLPPGCWGGHEVESRGNRGERAVWGAF